MAARSDIRLTSLELWKSRRYIHSSILEVLKLKLTNIEKYTANVNYIDFSLYEYNCKDFTDRSTTKSAWIMGTCFSSCSVFQYEILAIIRANQKLFRLVEHCLLNNEMRIAICADNQDMLKALNSNSITSSLCKGV